VRSSSTVRPAAVALAAAGTALLVAPRQVVRWAAPGEPEPPLAVVRVLGGRLVAQQLLVAARPTRRRVLAWAAVDAAHAASMVPAAALWPRHRRLATVSGIAGTASALVAVTSARALGGPVRPRPRPSPLRL
jgi:hypothetical protein